MTQYRFAALALGLLVLGAAGFMTSWSAGAHETTFTQTLVHFTGDDGSNTAFSVRHLRVPRSLCAFGVGMALALSGALIQVIVRNPLGDPGLTGVSAGAAFGVAITLTLITPSPFALTLAGFAGGFAAAMLTFSISGAGGGVAMQPVRVILAGIAVSVFFLGATSAVMVLARSSMQTLYFWLVGGFINRGWGDVGLLWPVLIVCSAAIFMLAPVLRLLRFDDTMAMAMGIRAGPWRLVAGIFSVALAGVCVAVAGPLSFVGFIAPHLARLGLGLKTGAPPMTIWLLTTALFGGVLVLWADCAAKLFLNGRVPAGVFTTVFGGLVFLVMARRGLADAR